jgi:hypothetical protein
MRRALWEGKMSGNHVWRNRRLEAEPVLPTGLLDKPITCARGSGGSEVSGGPYAPAPRILPGPEGDAGRYLPATRGTSTSRERASERQDRQVLGRQTDRLRGQARDSILSEPRQGKSRQADEDQVRRFHAGAGCLITCLV